MEFIYTQGDATACQALATRLMAELEQDKQVLWFLSGGSNIAAAVRIMSELPVERTSQLTVMLIDERFGPVGHADSNWKQLLDAGFDGQQAVLIPALQDSESLEQAGKRYNQQVSQALDAADISIAQLGMGADGHISGILPGSIAAEPQSELVISYTSDPYLRVTTTFTALQKISVFYLLAYGPGKKEQLTKLRDETIDMKVQPAQFLKQMSEVYIYNDQLEGVS